MKPTLRLIYIAAVVSAMSQPLIADTDITFIQGTSGTWNADWNGLEERTDFIQWSLDLQDWHFAPAIEYGAGVKSYGFTSSTNKFFVRLKHAYIPSADPEGDDYDYDNLSNIDEVTLHDTDPLEWDTDGDGMSDDWEIANDLDPRDDGSINPDNGADGDPDGDGVENLYEYWYQGNPRLSDTDGDGLSDSDELYVYFTSLPYADWDGDDLNDYAEVITYGTDPYSWDSDEDTLNDGEEVLVYSTNPLEMDSDGDWMWDDWELDHGLNPNSPADGLLDADFDTLANQLEFVFLDQGYNPFVANIASTFPWTSDPDWDGLSTQVEFVTHLTNPMQHDTDDDGYNDSWELANGLNPRLDNSIAGPANHHPDEDPDSDDLTNAEEEQLDANPFLADTDGDNYTDFEEERGASNPNDPDSMPQSLSSSVSSFNSFNSFSSLTGPPSPIARVEFTFGDHSGSHSEKYRVQLTPLEGDGNPQVRFRTNRKYGQTESRTFHLPKGAKYKLELIHIGTSSRYRGQPKPDYDYTLKTPPYVGDADTAVVTEDTGGILGVHAESNAFFAQGKNATVYIAWMTSETVATLPADRKRIKIGVGEMVALTLTPSSLPSPTWALTGNKELSVLSSTTGITNQLEAGARNCAPVATATINGKVVKITFEVIEPTGIVMRQEPGTVIKHTTGIPSAGFTGNAYITPDDVSFASASVKIREGACNATATGYYAYANGKPHAVGFWKNMQAGDATNPSKVAASDFVYSGEDGSLIPSIGTFEWVIPMQFQVNGGGEKQFTTITHYNECDAAGTVSIKKDAGPFSAALNDPTAP